MPIDVRENADANQHIFLVYEAKNGRQMRLSSLSIAGVYIGAVIGADFCIGTRDLALFRSSRLEGGFVGLALSGFLFAFSLPSHPVCRKLLQGPLALGGGQCHRRPDIRSPDGRLHHDLSARQPNGDAGRCGAGLAEQYSIPSFVGSTAMALATALTVLMGIQGAWWWQSVC